MMHINSISCGQGAPSLYLIVMAGQGLFPADVVITADTGWENDCLWSTGERTTAKEFWDAVTQPLAEEFGMVAAWVRANDGEGNPLPPLQDTQAILPNGKVSIDIPMYGSKGGKLSQSCTSKYKVAAMRQELRRRGARTATSHLGLTMDEVGRMKPNDVKWETKAWPLIERKLYRTNAVAELERMGIPYLVTSECDGCPHKDWPRWKRTSPAMIESLGEWESNIDGFFLTRNLIPLSQSLAKMELGEAMDMFEPCDDGYCFV